MITRIITVAALASLGLGGFYFYGSMKYEQCIAEQKMAQSTAAIAGAKDARRDQEDAQRAARSYSDYALDDRLDDLGILRK